MSECYCAIVGIEGKPETEALRAAIREKGSEVIVIDGSQWPGEATLGIDLTNDDSLADIFFPDHISATDVGVVYVDSTGFEPTSEENVEVLEENFYSRWMQLREYSAAVQNAAYLLTEHANAELINEGEANDIDSRKLVQLTRFDQAGLRVPDTIVANSPELVTEFLDEHDEVIYKPVRGGGSAKKLSKYDWNTKKEQLAYSPVQFQEYIPGDDIRAYVVDGEIAGAARVQASEVDFRYSSTADITPITPTEELEEVVVTAAELFDVQFGSVDVVEDESGEPVVLEVNTAPMFVDFVDRTGEPVVDQFAEYLIHVAQRNYGG